MARDPDVRWRQRFQSFRKAFGQLARAAATAKERDLSELEQQGLIQAFEFTHELAWNTLKDFLESRGASRLYASKDATRESFAKGLIDDGEPWMEMIQSRNRTSHTYNEETANEIADAILSRYVPEFEKFIQKFSELEKEKR
jgi:nucleotidyltransferase substrate binding protein (TIGR01987 family)